MWQLDATNLNSFRVIDLGRTGSLSVNSVLYDDGRIWISTIAHGVIYYNERTGKIKQLTYLLSSPYIHSTLRPDIYSHLI